MYILQVGTSDTGGGAESSAWNLFRIYRQRGHTSWLAVGRKYGDAPDVRVIPNMDCRSGWFRFWQQERARLASGNLSCLSRPVAAVARLARPLDFLDAQLGHECFEFPGTYQLPELFSKTPDIIHCHNLHGGYFDLRALPWLSHQVPLILNLRDTWLLTGHCANPFDCERWKYGCGRCPDLEVYPAIKRDATAYNWRRKKEIYTHSRLYITAVSQWIMGNVRESMLSGAAYKVIPNGIDLDIFHPGDRRVARQVLGLPLVPKVVLYAANGGQKSPWRDYRQLELAMCEVAASSREEVVLVCIGNRDPIQSEVRGNLRVIHLGFEPDPQRMALYYQAADVYALPALAEAFGKTITEAMACGVPVVATSVGGIPEQIVDGETGFLVPKSDVGAMAAAIVGLLKNESLCERLGGSASERASREYGLGRQADNFLNWYQEVRRDWLDWRKYEESHLG